jgi:pSer/pThr/pTyr-binding forkhead associated (FHA) protein
VLEIAVGDETYEFDDDAVVVIGRGESCSVQIQDHRVSRRHLEIVCVDGMWRLSDRGSANGTFAAGRRIQELDLRRPLDVHLADPDDGVLLRIDPVDSSATFTLTPAGTASTIRIGRARDNDIVLDDHRASRYHAELVVRVDGAELRDRDSANGTVVNGTVVDRAEVRAGDLVEIGDTTLRVTESAHRLTLEVVAEGATMQRDSVLRARRPDPEATAAVPALTNRERELLALVAGGASDRAIAEAMFISVTTVRSHLDRIDQKTGFRKRADLTRLALELGIEPRTDLGDGAIRPPGKG